MPRPRVRDEDRKRVARACDTCKRRKEKCDGQHPCLLCKRRGREPECTFTEGYSGRRKRDSTSSTVALDPQLQSDGDESTEGSVAGTPNGRNGHRNSLQTRRERRVTLTDALREDRANGNTDEGMAIESLLTLSGNRSGAASAANRTPVVELENPDMMFARNSEGAGTTAGGYGRYVNGGHGGLESGNMGIGMNNVSSNSVSGSNAASVESRAPVPKLARLLKDGHGKFIFVGDSSNLAFVQNIRRLVKSEIGESRLTSDPLRHAMVEVIPPHPMGVARVKVLKPGLVEAKDLVRHYLLASSGVVDLFDPDELLEEVCQWVNHGSKAKDGDGEDVNASIYYLVLAIGAQVRNGTEKQQSGDGESQAEKYLWKGRELVATSFMDDPSVLTIQSYALITLYMLSACRRNGAFMLLGIAVRAAYALGLHRRDISTLFDRRERKTRVRVWKSLRVLDLYMSASLGRPPATSEVDGGSVSWDRATRDYETIEMGGLDSSAMLRICFIFERIMNEVYCRREVSVQLVESISRQYRDWTLQLPAGLQTDGLDQKPGTTSPTPQQTIGVAHLKCSYYWSIILLTRPFLIFKVSSKIKGKSEDGEHSSSVTSTLSEACIDAALRSVEIATDLIHTPGVPKRLFLVTNSTFVSAMVISFAIFGEFDKHFPLMSSIEQAIAILAIMAKDDPSARRYEQITTYLMEAAQEHIRRREQRETQRRRQDIHNIFGDPIKESVAGMSRPLDQGILIPTDNAEMQTSDANQLQEPWQLKFEMPLESRGPVLTTSGVLAAPDGDGSGQPAMNLSQYGFEQNDYDPFSPTGSGVPSLPSYAEEFPLFSLMTEYEQLADPYQIGMS